MVELCKTVYPERLGRQFIVGDRISPILALARNQRVLNVGCCGSDVLTAQGPTVHRQISEEASFCVGIDVFADGIEKMRSDGDQVYLANAEAFTLRNL